MAVAPVLATWRQVVWRYARIPVVVYLMVAAIVASFQRSFLYHPQVATVEQLASPQAGVSPLTVTTDDGLALHGWHFASAGAAKDRPLAHAGRVVLYFSGNAGHRAYRAQECRLLAELGCDVVLVDYRGFGDNRGTPTEAGFALDAEAVWREVVDKRQVSPDKIVLYGESLGGGVAIRLAEGKCQAGTPPGGLIPRSTFASMTETAGYHMWFMPVSLLLIDRYPSDRRIPNVTCPILQFHGDIDSLVTLPMAKRLHRAAPAKSASGVAKKLVVVRGADHNDVGDVAGQDYPRELREFLARL